METYKKLVYSTCDGIYWTDHCIFNAYLVLWVLSSSTFLRFDQKFIDMFKYMIVNFYSIIWWLYPNDHFSGALHATNLGYLNPLLKTYSIALALGCTRHPCLKKRGRLYVSIPLIGGGVSSYAYSLREYGRFLLLLKVCLLNLSFF